MTPTGSADSLREAGAVSGHPGPRNRKRTIRYDKRPLQRPAPDRERLLPPQGLPPVATRYDKLAANFLSGVALAAALAFWL